MSVTSLDQRVRMSPLILPMLAVALLAAIPVEGQQADTAVVVGTALDTSSAPIPGATVTLTHLATSVATPVVTNERGQFRTPPLRIGAYDVSVELAGFKRFTLGASS